MHALLYCISFKACNSINGPPAPAPSSIGSMATSIATVVPVTSIDTAVSVAAIGSRLKLVSVREAVRAHVVLVAAELVRDVGMHVGVSLGLLRGGTVGQDDAIREDAPSERTSSLSSRTKSLRAPMERAVEERRMRCIWGDCGTLPQV